MTTPKIMPRDMDDLLDKRRDAWRLTDFAMERGHYALADIQSGWANRLHRRINERNAA